MNERKKYGAIIICLIAAFSILLLIVCKVPLSEVFSLDFVIHVIAAAGFAAWLNGSSSKNK